MVNSRIHAREVNARRSVVEDWALIVSMRTGIAQSQIAIDESLAAIASTRAAIGFLDRLLAGQISNRGATRAGDGVR
jgi:hypothetical protein